MTIKIPKWCSLVAAFVVNGYVWGNLYSYSVIYSYLRERAPQHEMHISLIGSIVFGVTLFGSLLMAPLMSRISLRLLFVMVVILYALGPLISAFVSDVRFWYLTYTLPVGLGGSGICILSYVTAARCYPSRVCAASTFVSIGTSVFAIVIPSAFQFLLKRFELSNSLLILTGCISGFLIFIPAFPGNVLIGLPAEETATPNNLFRSAVSMQIGSAFNLGNTTGSLYFGSINQSPLKLTNSMASIYINRRKDYIDNPSVTPLYNLRTISNPIPSLRPRLYSESAICTRTNKNCDIEPKKSKNIPVAKQQTEKDQLPPKFSIWKLMMKRSMIVWIFASVLHFSFNNIAYVHVTNYARYLTSHPLASPTYFMIAMGCGATVSKILYAVLIERFNFPVMVSIQITLTTFGISLCILGLLQCFSNVNTILIGLFLSTFLMGFGEGGIWSLAYPATYEACYPYTNTVIYCAYCAIISLPYCLGGPIGTFIYEITEDYAFAYYVASTAYLIAANILWLLPNYNDMKARAPQKLPISIRDLRGSFISCSQDEIEISS